MAIDMNGRDDTAPVSSTKVVTNGSSDPHGSADHVQGETHIRLGAMTVGGSPHGAGDSHPARRPIVSVKQPSDGSNLHVGKGVNLKGEVTSCGTLTIEGDVQAEATVGLLQISGGGSFEGSAIVDEAEIDGRFKGTLQVSGKLLVRRCGRVTGRLSYGQIEVERGAEIHGRIAAQFGPGTKNILPMNNIRKAWLFGN
ncbi:MAG: bactofilin family protein [Rhizomicrobium sp.]